MSSGINSNIVKGGALIHDTARFLRAWDSSLSGAENLRRVAHENVLGLPTMSRAADVAQYALRPRFVNTDHSVIGGLQALLDHRDPFLDACYFETTRADKLLRRFAECALIGWYGEGRLGVDVDITRNWLNDLVHNGDMPAWSDYLRRRVSQGLIATLRDFGRLRGPRNSPRKTIAPPGITACGFAYVAFRLYQQGKSSRRILASTVWRRWLLDQASVDDMLVRLAALGVVYYSRAGSTVRIDWRVNSLEEAAYAAV